MSRKIQVMIVDDSLSIRMLLNGLFSSAPDMEVVAMASNPIEAMETLKTCSPDVMTLDVEMPKMDGVTFLKKIMNLKPLPVVMISTLTKTGSSKAIEALSHGAVDVVGKPSAVAQELERQRDEIIDKVRAASYAKVGQKKASIPLPEPTPNSIDILSFSKSISINDVYPKTKVAPSTAKPLIAIGSSTGGPCVLKEIFKELQITNLPPILVVQHMGEGFTQALASSINSLTALEVCEAKDSMPIQNGHVYIAPGGKHLLVEKNLRGDYVCRVSDIERVNRHKPSVDMLFRSLSETCGKNSTAVLLTGMGDDGAFVLKELYDLGAKTMVQSEETCAVFGMPRMALKLEPKHKTLTPIKIAKELKENLL